MMNNNIIIRKFNLLTILFFFSLPLFSQTKTLWLSQNSSSCTPGVVTVNVRTKNFGKIEVFQGSVNWDSTKLKYTGYTIPSSAFNITASNINVIGNKLGFLWIDATLMGVSVPDSTVILTLNFSVVANATGSTGVMFGNKPTKQEIDTTDGNFSLAGIYKDTAFLGCVINLSTIKNTINISGCNSVVYKGVTYNSSTIKTDTIKGTGGCDSIYNTVNITVHKLIPSNNLINLSSCNSITYKSKVYTSSAIFIDTVKSTVGCDSIYNIVNIAIAKKAITNNNYLSGCNSVLYNSNIYFNSTVIQDTVRSSQGCDSIYNIVNITVNKLTPVTNRFDLSGCSSVEYNGITYTNSTLKADTIKSVSGCDSIYHLVNINVSKYNTATTTTTLKGCDSIVYKGKVYKSSTVITDTIKTIVSVSPGNIYWHEGFNNSTGSLNSAQSDSSLVQGYVKVTYQKADSGSWALYGAYRTISSACTAPYGAGHIRFLKYSDGTIPFVVSPIVYNGISEIHFTPVVTGSSGKRFTIQWTADTAATTNNWTNITDSLLIKTSCVDTTILVNLPTAKRIRFKDIAVSPIGYEIDIDSVWFKSIGVKNGVQCDSIYNVVNFVLTKNNIKINNNYLSGCGSVLFNNKVYTSSILIQDTVRSLQGCDSIYNITTITVNKLIASTSDTIKLSGCYYVVYNNGYYTTPAAFTDTVKNVTGCDSIYHRVIITIGNSNAVTRTTNLSDCNSVLYNGVTYTGSIVLHDTLRTLQGCDSVINVTNITIRKNATYAYITNSGSNTVSVINVADKSIVATIPVGNNPEGVSASGDGKTVYITNYAETTMNVIKTGTNTIAATLNGQTGSLQSNPGVCVSPDGSWLYLWGGGGIAIVNTATNTISSLVSTTANGLGGICTSPDGSKVYVTNAYTNAVTVINALNKTITKTVSVGSLPFGICISPDGKNVYVANKGSNTVNVINTAKNTISATISVGTAPEGICISPDGSKVYVTNYTSNTVSVINTTNNSIIATVTVGTNPLGISITPDGNEVYVANYNSNNVSVISTANNTVTNTIAVGTKPYAFGNFIIQSSNPLNSTINLSGCGTVVYKGITYTSSTVLKDTVKSMYGCDSIYNVTNITVTKINTNTNPISLSGCNSVTYKNITYTSSTKIVDTVKSAGGCDSIYNNVNITVTKMTNTVNTINIFGCNSAVYKGITYPASTVKIDTVRSVGGCDSVTNLVVITVTKLKPVTDSGWINGCNSVFYNNKVYLIYL